jgi:Txe/YoeB family toxin of toxin-antitoxin system
VSWKLIYTKAAQKDAEKLSQSGLKDKALKILEILKDGPFKNPPSFEKLVGDLKGAYSRRINFQQRIIYQILKKEKIVKIIRMRMYYEK